MLLKQTVLAIKHTIEAIATTKALFYDITDISIYSLQPKEGKGWITINTILVEYPDILTVKQVKEILQIGNNKVYSLLNCGEIPSFTVDDYSRIHRIYKSDLISYINRRINK